MVVIFIVVVRKALVGKMICDHGSKEDRPPLFIPKGLKECYANTQTSMFGE